MRAFGANWDAGAHGGGMNSSVCPLPCGALVTGQGHTCCGLTVKEGRSAPFGSSTLHPRSTLAGVGVPTDDLCAPLPL